MIPTGRTLYSFDTAYPSLIVRGSACAVRIGARRDGAIVAPTSGTYSLIAPGGAMLVNAQAISIASSYATYTIPAASLPATLEPLGEGWQEEWSLVFSGDTVPYVVRRTAALARVALYPQVNENDFAALYPKLSTYKSGSVTTYQPQIDEAWKQIMQRIIQGGRLPYLIRTPDALREAHLHLSLSIVFQGFGMAADSAHFRDLAELHRKQYAAVFGAITWQQDSAQSGLVDDPAGRIAAVAQLRVNASPYPTSGSGWRTALRRWV
jgi:hypothetical protein